MGLTRAQREAISLKCVEELENLLYKEKGEVFRTCDNMNTITWQVSEDNGKPIYGSIKFTLTCRSSWHGGSLSPSFALPMNVSLPQPHASLSSSRLALHLARHSKP